MKCYLMQKPKHKLSAEDKKKLRKDIAEYMRLSVIYGHTKALEILKEHKRSDTECPIYNIDDSCFSYLIKSILDLINRLQAENERLKPFEHKFAEYNSHIRVEDMLVCASSLGEWLEFCDNLKAEAYKEFAERVKAESIEVEVDNLLKKLVDEQPTPNDVKCIDCEYLELELPYAVCSKAYKGIVQPNDSCGKGKLKELVGEDK